MIISLFKTEAPLAKHAERRTVERADSGVVAYAEAGRGRPVLLIHGAMTNLDDMLCGPFDALSQSHRVIAFDRPGHGHSSRVRLADASPWRQAEVIHHAAVTLGVERPVVVGHSFGGAVAMAYALAFPDDTAGVVALAPIVFPEPRLELAVFGPRAPPVGGDLLARGASATVDRLALPLLWRAMFLPQAMPPRFERDFSFELAGSARTSTSTGEDAAAIMTSLWRNVLAYSTCRPRVHVLGGDRDLVINNALHGAVLAKIVPQGDFRSVPGIGHMIHHFAIDEVAAAVRDLAASAGGSPPAS